MLEFMTGSRRITSRSRSMAHIAAAYPARQDACWPPDDTEESVVGTDRHQMTIITMRVGANELARIEAGPGQPVPWQALSQTILSGFRRPDGSSYTTMPDVFIYKKPMDPDRRSFSILEEGPPALIIEVASQSTHRKDLDMTRGKGWSYARAGVQEYLLLDPLGLYLATPVRAWRLVDGEYQPWAAGADGIWWSAQIPIGFGVFDAMADVYSARYGRQLHEGEIGLELAAKEAELARKDAELAAKEAELAELRRRLNDLKQP
jgi:hypothetical protein